jgi:hypothetical protein
MFSSVKKFQKGMKICLAEKCEPDLILPFRLLEKIRNLSKPIINYLNYLITN